MRRVWLLALVTAPAIAMAQTAPTPSAGQITFPTVTYSAIDGFINAAECVGGTISLSWQPVFDTSTAGTPVTKYQLYAMNRTNTTGVCPTDDNFGGDNSLRAGPVGDPITSDVTTTMVDIEFSTSLIVAAAKQTCDTTSDVNIGLCVQALNGSTNIGTARGTVTLSRSAPNAPASASAAPGENALRVSWPESQGNPAAEYYVAEALTGPTIDPTQTATVTRTSGSVGAQSGTNEARIEGLTNGVIYEVRVTAFSTADNPSDPVFAGTASPQPVNDFWEAYKNAGGRETGGCASGAGVAGALAVLGVASLVALRRRR